MAKKRPIYIPFAGPALLEAPLLNKGSAFTQRERQQFNLEGLLPYKIETIEEQKARVYQQLCSFQSPMDKHIYLRNIQDTNETVYYRLVTDHLTEIMPLIYTPTVGLACQQFSKIYRRKRGLFISYPDRDRIEDMLQNATKQNVKVIVVTDGERILGLGDQGIGGMGIPIGKLALYTACGGISPAYTLPITLDVGTNNAALLDDPMYMGWRHPRITGDDYYQFVDEFIQAVKIRWPNALLQFEDFAQDHATPLLQRYRDQLCCFNDDIQGTAAVTVGTLLAACHAKGESLSQQRVVFAGAGSAGCGIAEQIVKQMMDEGLSEAQARQRIFLLSVDGLLREGAANLFDFQRPLATSLSVITGWGLSDEAKINLLDVVRHAKPGVLIGVSGQAGLFTKAVVECMQETCERPIILPLSNPTSQVEAQPVDLLRWTSGKVLLATGSPFEPVDMGDKHYDIAQCNNSYIFPGIGLAVITARITRITDNMLMAASRALADSSPIVKAGQGALLPPLEAIREVSKLIARAVIRQAIEDGVALPFPGDLLEQQIEGQFWYPEYREYRRTSF
ncbi:NAD-dependent malic enzyme [Cellvibrio japonicus]|uniref:malate dehydrogenase (oxaloacetate-decarboxylating) n=1 Tax=Cellvibrio japonicus (strain Ueda107) TaxID=498211 RepID=B3PEW3_CELJU|nr:NAD-dependent malic enzyme [Cellvibrio japonicus]ACE85444.1 NAD-dependent malic enzyme [Cellvibrio japonicus Ueda107]QEI12211.1 NAD-dependent malic enzyme [Cellvibrio japonicus]QEI15785.1 NAD-dependent malic enzyme [Cellvibrio japonicus]QEI19363.1 NAD-dependent malic enzyme [Cellvibrio japonicus]